MIKSAPLPSRHSRAAFPARAALLLSCLSFPVSGAVAAPCVTGADLTGGITAHYLDGSTMDYAAAGDALLRITEHPPADPGRGLEVTARFGIYQSVAQGLGDGLPVEGQTLSYLYSTPLSDLPAPVAGTFWLGRSATIFADGTRVENDAVYVFGRDSAVTIGGCDYRSVPVSVSFVNGQDWSAQDYLWLPEIGIAVLTRRQSSGENRASEFRVSGLAARTP